MKRNGHCTFEAVFDSWNAHSDENINSGTILSFDVACMGSPVIIKSKQTSLRKNYEFLKGLEIIEKSRETREVCRYTSEHLIPNSVMVFR